MTATKRFHIGDILSITTGALVSPEGIGGVYQILNWMTGDNLFTHQLPRAARECEPALREQFPGIAAVVKPEGLGSSESAWMGWLAAQADRFGMWHEVAPLAAEDHTIVDPLREIAMMRPDAHVIAVIPPEGDDQGSGGTR